MPHSTPAPSGILLNWSGRTDPGKVRPNNEDAFIGMQFDGREIHYLGSTGEAATAHLDFAFAVSDGMGGAKAGEHASRIAVQKIAHLLPRSFRLSAAGLEAGFADVLEELFIEVHEALVQMSKSYEECSGMEATLSLCWFTPGWMYFAHVGDSRIYYLPSKEGPIKQVTQDDTYVGWLFRNGKLNEREARSHPRRNVLQKALGGRNQFVTPQIGAIAYEAGDSFLLCTDGLVDGLYDSRLEEFLRAGASAESNRSLAASLVDEALCNSGRDNTTALVVRAIKA